MRYLKWLWQNMKGIRANTAVRIVVGVSQVALALLMVWLCRHFIDDTIHGPSRGIVMMALLLVAVVGGNIVLRQAYYFMTIQATTRQSNAIRLRIFSHLLRRRIYDDQLLHSGDVTSRLERDVEQISEAVTSVLPQMLVTSVQLLGAFTLLHSMDARLAWMLLVSTPVLAVLGKLFAHRLRDMTHEVRQEESRIQMLLQEGMEHNAMLRALESGSWLTGQLDGMQNDLTVKILRRTRFTMVARTLLAACFGFGYLLAFVWGGLQLRNGVITFGVMTSFLQLVAQIQHPILNLLNMVPQLIHASASIDRLQELEAKPSEQENAGSALLSGRLGLRIEQLSFRYADGNHDIINTLSHDFRVGSKTALLGETGAGKTTLFRLMLSLIVPQAGRITIYNEQGDELEVGAHTRGNFVFVPQGNTLMSGTIRYNLQLANPKATDDEMWRVLHLAAADFVGQLPEGLDTECGERGGGLSEGQAQRIAIARGLLRPGGILLLDEISASLDEQTEQLMFSRLFEAYPQKTIILITHRTAVTRLCDDTIHINTH